MYSDPPDPEHQDNRFGSGAPQRTSAVRLIGADEVPPPFRGPSITYDSSDAEKDAFDLAALVQYAAYGNAFFEVQRDPSGRIVRQTLLTRSERNYLNPDHLPSSVLGKIP